MNATKMWVDPRVPSEKEGSVLLADDIRDYCNEHGLLIEKGFKENNLKGASYSLSPHDSEGWLVDDEGRIVSLEVCNSGGQECFFVPKNSLVYIKIKEKLKIPYYIIGRHNLKVSYVYKGLLLGTGPQVDPGFNEHLIIPLHNLTNSPVEILHDKSFVSIDFIRTSKIHFNSKPPTTEDEFRSLYPTKKQISLSKNNRISLYDYLKDSRPQSSMGELRRDVEQKQLSIEEDLKSTVKTVKNKITFGGITSVALFVSFLAIVASFYCHLDSKITPLPEVSEQLKHLKESFNDKGNLESEISILKTRLMVLEKKLNLSFTQTPVNDKEKANLDPPAKKQDKPNDPLSGGKQ